MEDRIIKKLSEMPPAKLVEIILAALETMGEAKKTSFIAKYIDVKTSLARVGADSTSAFLDEVEEFCLNCLNCEYYSDQDDIEEYFSYDQYDSHYDDYLDYDEYFAEAEWARTFERLIELSIMYIQSGDFTTGYEATSRILACLKEMEKDECFLGTDSPRSYIATDWNELFTLHYDAMFQFHTEPDEAIRIAFSFWLRFGTSCNEGFLRHVKDISIAEQYILRQIKSSADWTTQRLCFDLLAKLHERLDEPFDKPAEAAALIENNVYFYLCVVEALHEKEQWHDLIRSASEALHLIQPMEKTKNSSIHNNIRAEIQSMQADACVMLSDFSQAFETVKLMFQEAPSFKLYKRGRSLAEKTDNIGTCIMLAEKVLGKDKNSYGFSHKNLLRDIYSYEGAIDKIMDMAKSQEISTNYYDRKYIAVSIIFRAMSNVADVSDFLAKYLSSQGNLSGVEDMVLHEIDDSRRTELLMYADDLLRDMISFHIDAATRSRYSKAAYYMCVLRDIFIFLNREDDFKQYFQGVIQKNSRRPALRDEMSVVYGKTAVSTVKRK